MAYLSGIIEEIKRHFDIEIHGNHQNRHTIDGIRFLTDNDANISYLSPNILHLASFSKYGKQTLYGDVLFIGCQAETPVSDSLYIREDIDMIELYNVIEDVLLCYQQVEIHKQSLFGVLHNGSGLDALLQTAYKYINNPIVLCDSSYSVLSSYPEVIDDVNLEIRNHRLSLKSVFSENMKHNQITDHIYHSVYPFATKVDDYPYDWIFQSVRIKRAVIGYVCIRCIEREYTDADLDLIHTLTQMISIQLQKDDSYRNPQGIKYDMFLRELFSRHLEGEETIKEQLSFLGVKPSNYYYLVICSFCNPSTKLMAYHYYIQQLSSILPNSITGVFGNRFVTLVSTSEMKTLAEKQESRLETFLTMNHMIATVSYLYDTLRDSSAYFAQCNSLISERLVTYNENPIIYYGDHYLTQVVDALHNMELLSASIHPSIKFMRKHDKTNHTEYLHTLEVFFDNNRNAQATANALFIHKSTLFYRFDKMKQLFDIRLDDKDALFSYEYSLRLVKILFREIWQTGSPIA